MLGKRGAEKSTSPTNGQVTVAAGDCTMSTVMISLITRYNSGDEADGVCDRDGRRERCIEGF